MEIGTSEESRRRAPTRLLPCSPPRSRDHVSTGRAVEMRYMDRTGQFTWSCLGPVKFTETKGWKPMESGRKIRIGMALVAALAAGLCSQPAFAADLTLNAQNVAPADPDDLCLASRKRNCKSTSI